MVLHESEVQVVASHVVSQMLTDDGVGVLNGLYRSLVVSDDVGGNRVTGSSGASSAIRRPAPMLSTIFQTRFCPIILVGTKGRNI